MRSASQDVVTTTSPLTPPFSSKVTSDVLHRTQSPIGPPQTFQFTQQLPTPDNAVNPLMQPYPQNMNQTTPVQFYSHKEILPSSASNNGYMGGNIVRALVKPLPMSSGITSILSGSNNPQQPQFSTFPSSASQTIPSNQNITVSPTGLSSPHHPQNFNIGFTRPGGDGPLNSSQNSKNDASTDAVSADNSRIKKGSHQLHLRSNSRGIELEQTGNSEYHIMSQQLISSTQNSGIHSGSRQDNRIVITGKPSNDSSGQQRELSPLTRPFGERSGITVGTPVAPTFTEHLMNIGQQRDLSAPKVISQPQPSTILQANGIPKSPVSPLAHTFVNPLMASMRSHSPGLSQVQQTGNSGFVANSEVQPQDQTVNKLTPSPVGGYRPLLQDSNMSRNLTPPNRPTPDYMHNSTPIPVTQPISPPSSVQTFKQIQQKAGPGGLQVHNSPPVTLRISQNVSNGSNTIQQNSESPSANNSPILQQQQPILIRSVSQHADGPINPTSVSYGFDLSKQLSATK